MPRRTENTVLESRVTEGLDIVAFLNSLAAPPLNVVAKRLHLNSPLKFNYWRQHQYLPWALYLALRDIYGTPKFHEIPKMARAKRAIRVPVQLQKYVEYTDLPPKTPQPCQHDFKPTSLGYLMCVHCGERGAVMPPEPIPAESVPLPPPTTTGFAIPITWNGPDTLTLRIEVATLAPPATAPSRERELLARITELEEQLADLKALQQVQHAPNNAAFTKNDRHLLRTVAKQNPDQARALARTMHR